MNERQPTGAPQEPIMTTSQTATASAELEPCGKAHDAEQSRTDEIEDACNDSVN